MGNADYIWEQIGVWFTAVKLAGVDAGCAFDVAGEGGGFGDE